MTKADLTSGVKAQIDPAIAEACRLLRRWGIQFHERTNPLATNDFIGPEALAIGDYECGRPVTGGDTS